MLTLPLEPTDDRANPIFKDAAGCAQWIEQLQLTNLRQAHSQLLTQINELTRYPMRGLERRDTLELLRDTVHYVQNEYTKKLVAKPLPLSENELIIFVAIIQLWQTMSLGYQRCLQAYIAGDKQLAGSGALLCQRCLMYSGMAITEHMHTGYEFDDTLWRQLHELYAFAEKQGLHVDAVSDPVNGTLPSSSCHDIYVKTLLTCHACPAELTRSQLLLVDVWLSEWSKEVPITRSYTPSKGGDAQPLAVDLASCRGLQPVSLVASSSSVRYLAMVPLSKSIRVNMILLQQGRPPQQIEFGQYNSARECIDLLTFLHSCWCEENNTRQELRRTTSQNVQLYYNPEQIYAHMTGKSFKQSVPSTSAIRMAMKQIEALGRVMQNVPEQGRMAQEPPPENWRLENDNLLGASLTRIDMQGGRLRHDQLVALRIGDSGDFKLGKTAWAKVNRSGQLQIGMRYFPGGAEAIRVRSTGLNKAEASPQAPAFLLQAVPTIKIPASLLIPRDWFQPGRVLEINKGDNPKQYVKLGISVEKGHDFERVSFSEAHAPDA